METKKYTVRRARTRIGVALATGALGAASFGLAATVSQGTAGASTVQPAPNVVTCSPSGCLPGGGTISTIIGKGGAA